MVHHISLTLCSFIFYIFLMIIYMSKIKKQSLRTTTYLIMLILCGLFAITEIVTFCLYELECPKWLLDASWTIHWLICNISFWSFFMYAMYISYKIEAKKYIDIIKYNWITKASLIILIIDILLAIFVLPAEPLDYNNIDLINMNSSIYCAIMVASFIVILIKKKDNLTKNEKKGIIFTIIAFLIFVLLQAIFKSFSFIPFGFFAVYFSLYFNSENPDLRMLEDMMAIKEKIDVVANVKNDFLANITDDIKNPSSLIGSISKELSVLDLNDQENMKKLTDELSSAGNNLLDIINNILNIADIGSSQVILQEKKYLLKEMINDLVIATVKKIGSKNITFLTNIDESMSTSLLGDSTKIQQVLTNILNNAVENTNVGRIILTVTSTKSNGVEEILFKIADTGCGIKDEDKEKIFTPNTTKKDGLGLSIAKKYIDSMNGKVWFESSYQVGSTFYVQIGQRIIDSTPIGKISYEEKIASKREYIDCTGFKVLIVDDNEFNIRVTKKFLERYHFDVEYVLSANDCIYNIKSEKHYDLIFADYSMPDMDGIELLHSLRALEGYKIPPVIMLTANAIIGMKEKYLKEGFNDYISKPINSEELDKIINKFFKVKK